MYLVHLILEYAESGSTATLYLHGMSRAFALLRVPIQYSDEAGERDLRLGKTFAALTTNRLEESIRATLTHELYVKFKARMKRRSQVTLWKPVRRVLVLDQCVLSASGEWRAIAERVVQEVLKVPSVAIHCHPGTQSVPLQPEGASDGQDIYCICGRCGAERRGVRDWGVFSMGILHRWPIFNYAAVGAFCSSRERKAHANAQQKEKKSDRCCAAGPPSCDCGNCP